MRLTQSANRERAALVLEELTRAYPDACCSLDFHTPLELLIATILAAQCTDVRVNIVTKDLFKKYRTAKDYIDAADEALQEDIRTCGFYRQKTKSIKRTCEAIERDFRGQVPSTIEELTQLNGVGRKTANVLLAECFDTPGIIVDTHCTRLSNRLGFTKDSDPAKIEQDLMKLVPRENWTQFSHTLVFHGRAVCAARAPKCSACPLRALCPFPETREGKRLAK